MPAFDYTAQTASGEITSGTLDASDRRAAAQRLARRGLSPVRIIPADAAKNVSPQTVVPADLPPAASEDHPALHKKRFFGAHPIARSFMEKLHSLMSSGLPAGDAVKLLRQRVSDPPLRALCARIWRDLSEGLPLAGAMGHFPEIFDAPDVRLVESGEAAGTLTPVIKRLLDHYAAREGLRAKILASMIYPLCIIALACAVIGLFVFFLMPMLQDMMTKLGGEMNMFTRGLIGLSAALLYGTPLITVIGVTAYFSSRSWRESEEGRAKTDAWILRTPLVGDIVGHVESARLCSLVATLLENGLNTPDALRMAERASANRVASKRISAARKLISDGASFAAAFRRHAVLPQIDLDVVAVGESSGTLPTSFRQLAEKHEKSLDAALRRLVATLSAALLGSAVAIVFLCLLSIVLSILSVSQSAAR